MTTSQPQVAPAATSPEADGPAAAARGRRGARLRSWSRYRLRTLLIVVTIICVPLGVYTNRRLARERAWRLLGEAEGLAESLHDGDETFLSINLERCPISDALIYALPNLGRIRHLNFKRTSLSDEQLGRLTSLRELRSLDISYTHVAGDGIQQLSSLPELGKLQTSDLQGTTVSLHDFSALESLYISGPQVQRVALQRLPALKELGLSAGDGLDLTIDDLSSLDHLSLFAHRPANLSVTNVPNLRNLYARAKAPRGESSEAETSWRSLFTSLAGAANLCVFDSDYVPIADEDLRALAGLRHICAFFADHDSGQVTDEGIAALANWQELERFEMRDVGLSEGAIDTLARLGKLEKIKLPSTILTATMAARMLEVSPLKWAVFSLQSPPEILSILDEKRPKPFERLHGR